MFSVMMVELYSLAPLSLERKRNCDNEIKRRVNSAPRPVIP